MKTFEINGKEYSGKPFDFNLVCDLEDMGVTIENMTEKVYGTVRAYIALCMNSSRAEAGREMEEHYINGGDFEEAAEVMTEEMEKSDFFQELIKRAKAETAKAQTEKKTGGRKTAKATKTEKVAAEK